MAGKTETNRYQDKRMDSMENSMKVINSELGGIKVEISELKTDFRWLKTEFVKMRTALEEIKDKVNKRPTWFTATVFSVLFSALVGLVVYLITQ